MQVQCSAMQQNSAEELQISQVETDTEALTKKKRQQHQQ